MKSVIAISQLIKRMKHLGVEPDIIKEVESFISIEREQVVKTANDCFLDSDLVRKANRKKISIGEQYYNQTFKKSKLKK